MTQSNTLFIAMDVHKESIEIAIAEDGISGEVRRFGRIAGTKDAFLKALRKWVAIGKSLHFCYEAGPTGYELYRTIIKEGHLCTVIAPSLIPKRAGDKVKTDKRDAISLAKLFRAGELTAVYVPKPEDEAIRDLTRAREDAVHIRTKAKQRLKAFLLRHDIRCPRSENWSEAHLRWLAEIKLPHAASQVVFQEYLNSVTEAVRREQRLLSEIEKHVKQWRLYPAVISLMALRGVRMVIASSMIAELGDLSHFEDPKRLMSYLGLTPSEHSSGERTKRGAITKTGNNHARKMLIEAAWSYRFDPKVSREIQKRQEDLPLAIRDIAWKAQLRLTHRYKTLSKRKSSNNVVVVAIARELVGFMWAIFHELDITPNSEFLNNSQGCAFVDNASRWHTTT